jgi:UDP-N-acetylmuramate dehydrogenase
MPKFQENVLLSKYSHYKIGGRARFFFNAKTEKDVKWAVKEAKARKLKIFILAGGTNLLISDEGFNGLVLRPDIQIVKVKKDVMTVGAGVVMADLVKDSAARSLSGLEWAGGLPGTVGGAIRGNAGCFGGEIKDNIIKVRSFDIKKMVFIERTAKQCGFTYRHSIFKKKNGSEIIVSATIKLEKGDKKVIAKAIKEKIEYRKKNHPLEYPNIGSIFKNVPLHSVHEKNSAKYNNGVRDFTINLRGSQFSIKTDPFPVISAAKLISESGLRGVSFGGAMISPKHPNFIVNVLNAGSLDVKNLMTLAKAEVHKKFGIDLEEEVQMI